MTGAECGQSSELLKWLGQAFVVGLGWFVVHRLSASRDRDKSRREMAAKSADQLVDALTSLLAAALAYHLANRDEENELSIKMIIQDMSMRVAGLSKLDQNQSSLASCRAAIANVRRAVTGSHFEDEHDGPLHKNNTQIQTMAEAFYRAKRDLLDFKHQQFQIA